MSAQEHAVYRFADCELDTREHRLLVHGQAVTLTPKVFDTLVLLVTRAGHVVSKDELMAALWPRGFVHESNLTKHIWLIRRALGDDGNESRCIETVPKLGYRFIAPVQQVALSATPIESSVGQSDHEVASVPSTAEPAAIERAWIAGRHAERRHGVVPDMPNGQNAAAVAPGGVPGIRFGDRLWLAAIALALIGLGGGMYGWLAGRTTVLHASAPDAGAVAIVDFNNLSGNAKDAWLGPALEQMLATEVAANGKLHAVSEELVRPARADLPAPAAGGYAPSSLEALQRRLGAHYILSGAYLVSGSGDTPQLRVDLIVQDAHDGTSFATLSRVSAITDLPDLVARLGGELRRRFGERSDPATLKQLASAQPASMEVARHLGFALQALDQYDASRARDELLQAIAQSPGYAPAYLYLARAWAMLGFRAKAFAAAKQAAQYAKNLPHEEQLQIRAEQAALSGDASQLAALRNQLVALRPRNPEYRLQWIEALVGAAKYDQAQAVLTDARKLPELQGDPRVELAAATIDVAQGNLAAALSHAHTALQRARQRGATGLIAEAELRAGIALDQDAQAEPMLRQAAADFRRLGNPHGEAGAWQNLGNLQSGRNQIAAARESYQRAMMIYQGGGDLAGEAAIYDNLSNMLWSAGDRDGTEAALKQALTIARETGDERRQAWTLTGLATVMSDDSASDEAAAMYREAIALDHESGARSHLAFALANYADLLRMRGRLDEARDVCAQARAADHALAAASRSYAADFECAQVALDRGRTDAAAESLKSIESKAAASGDTFNSA
ncbi:MAG TPA: winged helix-turn-helix domain-containing protein, partial [Rhodanobacteraceae bacterium]|nr:winged helix-turn-helix domain-containing protein [Rhodanobacteraceae bacterium]